MKINSIFPIEAEQVTMVIRGCYDAKAKVCSFSIDLDKSRDVGILSNFSITKSYLVEIIGLSFINFFVKIGRLNFFFVLFSQLALS